MHQSGTFEAHIAALAFYHGALVGVQEAGKFRPSYCSAFFVYYSVFG